MAKCLKPRKTRRYYDNLIRYRLEVVIMLFSDKSEQRLTDLMEALNIDRSAVHQFMRKLVDRKFIRHEHGGLYVLPRTDDIGIVCLHLDWLYSEPRLFFCGYRDGAMYGWWAITDREEDEPKQWLGAYLDWAARSFIPNPPLEVASWSRRLGSAIRRVIRLFLPVNKSRSDGPLL